MAEYLKRENRRDTKWAHPESLSATTWIVPGLMDHFYHLAEMGPEAAIAARI